MGIIEKYGHGGDLLTASERFGLNSSSILDFSANINPLGPPGRVMQALQNQLGTITHYPDPDQRKMKKALARRLGVEQECLLIGNGAAECMALALLAQAPRKVGVVYPCFSEYAQLAGQYGAEVRGILGRVERDYKPDMKELCHLIEWADLVFIGHPNNPTGIVYDPAELILAAEAAGQFGTRIVMDEAFLDFLPEDGQTTLLHDLARYPQLIFIRSMTKFYAIPGLRLGYGVADPKITAGMKGKQVTWSVNSLALLAGELCLQETEYERQTRKLIQEQREQLVSFIGKRLGWTVWPGQANFLLVRMPAEMSSVHLQQWLGNRGILIRDCSMYPGLTGQDFRIAVLDREKNERLMQSLVYYAEEWGSK